MKCALAHILPDGRVVNPKSMHHKNGSLHQNQQQQRGAGPGPAVNPNDPYTSQQPPQQLKQSFNGDVPVNPTIIASTQGPTTSATIRNIYMSAASAAYNGAPDYTQNLSSTPRSYSQSHNESIPGNDFSTSLGSTSTTPRNSSSLYMPNGSNGINISGANGTVPNVIGENGPVIGSLPLVHHHKAASFIIPATSSDYQSQLLAPQSFSASSAALHQHRQQQQQLSQQQASSPQIPQSPFASANSPSQRSFSASFSNGSASASIWNKKPSVSSSLRPTSVSMLMGSLSNMKIPENGSQGFNGTSHQEFLENHEFAIDDDDNPDNNDGLEDFVPSSLTDLLTDQERQRRGSRPSSSNHPAFALHQLHHQLSGNGTTSNHRQSFNNGNGNPDIWGSSSPRTFARRSHLEEPNVINGDGAVGYGSPLRSSFSVSNNNGSSSLQNQVQQAPIGTPDGSSYMASYKSQTLGHNHSLSQASLPPVGTPITSGLGSLGLSKTSLTTGVGSSVLSDDDVTGVLTASNDDNTNGTGSGNEGSEYDEIQFQMDEEVPQKTKVNNDRSLNVKSPVNTAASKFGLVR